MSGRAAITALAFLALTAAARGAVAIDAQVVANGYTQDFDGLPGSSSFTWANDGTLPGWHAVTSAGALNTAALIATGGGNLNDLTLYSVGASSSADRALTYHTRVDATATCIGLELVNATGADLQGFSVSHDAEQWRENTNQRTLVLAVQYRVGATAGDLPSASGWTTIPGMQADTLNGAAGKVTSLSSGPVAATVPAGSTLWIRWVMSNTATASTSSHDILAIDNVAFHAGGVAPETAPVFTQQPLPQSAAPGDTVTFTAAATGNPQPTFQWYFAEEPLDGAVDATLVLEDVQQADAGDYRVVASNSAGSVSSDTATLTVTFTPQAPVITAQPAAVVAEIGADATFSVGATGTAPLAYQWHKDGAPVAGADGPQLILYAVGPADVANYHAVVSNAYGSATSAAAGLTVMEGLPASIYSLTGFGQATTGGGVIPDTDPRYRKVYTPLQFVAALADRTANAPRVIEVMNDLDLGYLEVEQAVRDFSIFRQHTAAKLHPVLIASGVSRIDIQDKNSLTLFSANGASIRHASLNIKRVSNMIIRNLKFDELWEWDEATKGNYDSNDWDFITLGDSGTVWDIWIDHCTFTKAYDGIVDIKGGSYNITFSWCNYTGDDGATNPSSWVRRQISHLEANKPAYPMYNFLRSNGFSVEDIVLVEQGTHKTHLIGANTSAENANFKVTFHHQWYQNPWDRLPRLRAGNVHNYNIYVDDERGRQAKALRDARVAAMPPSEASKLSSTYNFNVFLNGSISTEGGAILVEKSYYKDCLTPLRNNQTDPSDPFYTGKILGLDCITRMTDNAGVSVTVRGDSTDPGNPMGPFQAPVIPFSWNLPGGVLPYTAQMDDPADLPEILLVGAGAGRLGWAKENWLKTTYAIVAPVITQQPAARTVMAGGTVTFTVAAASPTPLSYQWRRNGIPIEGEQSASLTLTGVAEAAAGTYSVLVTNADASLSSAGALLTVLTEATLPGYAFGFVPGSADQAVQPVVQAGPGSLAIAFTRLRANVTYTVKVSSDLEQWTTLAVNPGTVGQEVAVADPQWPAAPRRFLRVEFALAE